MSSSDVPTPAGRASERFAALVQLPPPRPLTPEEEAAYRTWQQDAEDQQEALNERRNPQRAA